MRRLYYLANDLHLCERVARALEEEGIGERNFHVLSRDEIGVYQHRIHPAATWHQRDVIHTGERWALAGVLLGAVIAIGAWLVQPFGGPVSGVAAVVIICAGGLLGALQGALAGLSRENCKIARFRDELDARRHLVMVDVGEHNRARIREIMNVRFPSMEFCGGDSTWVGPFANNHLPAPGSSGPLPGGTGR